MAKRTTTAPPSSYLGGGGAGPTYSAHHASALLPFPHLHTYYSGLPFHMKSAAAAGFPAFFPGGSAVAALGLSQLSRTGSAFRSLAASALADRYSQRVSV